MDRVDAVVVAAGSSERMGGQDKLGAMLLGRPVLIWALEGVDVEDLVGRLILVAPPERQGWLDREPGLRSRVEVVAGGARRQESVAAGVRAASAATVLIHDAARPLATTALARRVAAAAARHGAAIPVLPIAETVKEVDDERVSGTVPRDGLAVAQTPQAFRRDVLLEAWRRFPPDGPDTWTDEAALVERLGVEVRAVPGEVDNLKLTVATDLARAERILASRHGIAVSSRIGIGRDGHPFGPGGPLALGGITMPEAPALVGHSDGDVALHAVADALLGAAALGDLGRLFPAGDAATRGIESAALLREVVSRLAAADLHPMTVDLTIVGARPHLGPARLEAMRSAIADLLGLDVASVSVKASSGNLSGDEGAGRTVSAQAIATVAYRSTMRPDGSGPAGNA